MNATQNPMQFNVGTALNIAWDLNSNADKKPYFKAKAFVRNLADQFKETIDSISRLPKVINVGTDEKQLKRLLILFIGMSQKVALLNNDYIDARNEASFNLFRKIAETDFNEIVDFNANNIVNIRGSNSIADEISVEQNLSKLFSILDSNEAVYNIDDEKISEIFAHSFIVQHRTTQQSFVAVMVNTINLMMNVNHSGLKTFKDTELVDLLNVFSQIEQRSIPYI